MITFAQLQQLVYAETLRSDAIAQTTNSLLSATTILHSLDFFYKDLAEALVVFEQAAYLQQIDTSILPRFRQLNYLKKWDPTYEASELTPTTLPPLYNNTLGVPVNHRIALRELTILTPDDILDNFGVEKLDVCYQVGSSINVKSSTKVAQAHCGFYQYPFTDTAANSYAGYTSWIANEFPFALVYYAASNCFAQFGDLDASKRYCERKVDSSGNRFWAGLAADHINNLIQSNIVAKGW